MAYENGYDAKDYLEEIILEFNKDKELFNKIEKILNNDSDDEKNNILKANKFSEERLGWSLVFITENINNYLTDPEINWDGIDELFLEQLKVFCNKNAKRATELWYQYLV